MKKISMLMMAALAVTALSCNKENAIQEEENQPVHRQTLVAQFADEETKDSLSANTISIMAFDKSDSSLIKSRSPFCKMLVFILLPNYHLPCKGQPYSYNHAQCNINNSKADMSCLYEGFCF